MKVDVAMLCDAVTVREGLLNILGGGITRLNRTAFPSTFSGALALRILVNPLEAGAEHKLQIIFQTEDGDRLAEVGGQFQTSAAGKTFPGEELSFPIGMAFQTPIPQVGAYSFEVAINGEHRSSIPVWAVLVEPGRSEEERSNP